MSPVRRLTLGLVACAAAFAGLPAPSAVIAVGGGQAASAPTIFIDASVTDASGRAVTTLRPEDLRVSVDGRPRKVVSLRYVCRGPGADIAAALVGRSKSAAAAVERTRLLLLVADENAIVRGQQKPVTAAVARVLDGLGSSDLAAVATLPRPQARLVLNSDAVMWQAAVAHITGRAVADTPASTPDFVAQNAAARGADPDEQARIEVERRAARDRRGASDDATDGPSDARPGASIRALREIIDGLAKLPGPKSVLVFRQAESVSGAGDPDVSGNLTSAVLESAARARVVVHLVMIDQTGRKRTAQDDGMAEIAVGTGGTIRMAKNASDSKAFDGILAALEGGYLVEVEGREGDAGARPHDLKVECSRRQMTVRVPRLWVSRQDPVPAVVVAAPPGTATPAAELRAPGRRPNEDDPQVTLLLARLSEYITAYVRDVGNVVADEDYTQRLFDGGWSKQRRLKSDLLLVKTDAEVGWTQYRDVYEVDGRPVRDREERVQKLFLENPASAPRLAEQIGNESSRYNIGTLIRTINTPTLPLAYLGPSRIGGVSFRRDGEETVEGVRAARLAFVETARPTLVRPVKGPGDAPANGMFWVDPSSGRILKTSVTVTAGNNAVRTTVVYKRSTELGLWLPAEMDERSATPDEVIQGRAVYSNYRSFKVTTDVQIK